MNPPDPGGPVDRPLLFEVPVDHPDFLWLHGITRHDPDLPVPANAWLHILTRYNTPHPDRALLGLAKSLAVYASTHAGWIEDAADADAKARLTEFVDGCSLVYDVAQDTLAFTGDPHAALRAALAVLASAAVHPGFGAALAAEMMAAATDA